MRFELALHAMRNGNIAEVEIRGVPCEAWLDHLGTFHFRGNVLDLPAAIGSLGWRVTRGPAANAPGGQS